MAKCLLFHQSKWRNNTKCVRQMKNNVAYCEEDALLRMQKKSWMDSIHFIEWMDHFFHKMERMEGQSQSRRHLLIFYGHKSHISLDILAKAKEHKVDMISICVHTSHELQSFHKACFRPFKVAFGAYRDLWNIKYNGRKW